MKHIKPSLRMLFAMTVLTGLIYPLLVTVVGSGLFREKANGSLIERDGKIVGSKLLSQKFESDRYFKSRPSAGDFNPLPSGGTNLGPTAKKLKESSDQARAKLGPGAPQDLIFASGSGLDPHVSPDSARSQIERVAQARGFTDAKKRDLSQRVEESIERRQFGFIGEDVVNVLVLNLALDRM